MQNLIGYTLTDIEFLLPARYICAKMTSKGAKEEDRYDQAGKLYETHSSFYGQ